MLPKPYVPFQLSFDTGSITLGLLRAKLNEVILGLVTPADYLTFELRLGAVGMWELSGGDITTKVYDPIVVLTDLAGSGVVGSDRNTLHQVIDFAARNKWAHDYYRYKPEVHNRPLRIDAAPAVDITIIEVSTTATEPKIHIQLFGSYRIV
jgi:hypothetical protein